MRINSRHVIALVIALSATAFATQSARAAQVQWNVHGERSASSLLTISDADNMLDGHSAVLTNVTGHYNTINFNEPDRPLGGLFKGDVAFPGTSVGHEEDFAIRAAAYLKIPKAGTYTFGVSSDDGFSLSVGTHTMSFDGLRPPGQSYSAFVFPKGGIYPVTLSFFEHQIAAEVELFATPGKYTSFNQSGAKFALVGDVAHGGLELVNLPAVGTAVPEPAGLMLMFIPFVLAIRRAK